MKKWGLKFKHNCFKYNKNKKLINWRDNKQIMTAQTPF